MDLESNEIQEEKVKEDVTAKIYPSAKVLLDILKKENDFTYDIKKQLETRATALLAFSGVLLVFFSNKIDIKKSIQEPFIFALLIIFVFIILLAIREFINVIKTREYIRANLTFEEEIGKIQEDIVEMNIVKTYDGALKGNIEINKEKAIRYDKGVKFLSYSVLLLIVLFIFTSIYI